MYDKHNKNRRIVVLPELTLAQRIFQSVACALFFTLLLWMFALPLALVMTDMSHFVPFAVGCIVLGCALEVALVILDFSYPEVLFTDDGDDE